MEGYPLWNGGAWERPQSPPPTLPVFPTRKRRRPAQSGRKRNRGLRGFVLFLSTITLLTVIIACVVQFGVPQAVLDLLPQGGSSDSGFGFHFQQDDPVPEQPTTIRRAAIGGSARMELVSTESAALSWTEIYSKNTPSIVYIQARSGNIVSSGTGIILSEDGYIITNEHVISGASSALVVFHDDTRLPAQLVGCYAKQDLAVLKVESSGLIPAEFGDSDQLQVGDPVVAIGNPLGITLRGSMTDGIVSAINRPVDVDGETMTLIQTTAALNPGNSGGALINSQGQIIGVTTLKMMSEEETIEGLGFAIPTREAKTYVDQIIAKGAVLRLGISVWSDVERYGGLLVDTVDPRSNAWTKGLLPGDVIVAVNGAPVVGTESLETAKESLGPEDALVLTVRRGERQLELAIPLTDDDLLS